MVKGDYAHTLATLLSLDRVMEKELMKLSIETLSKMYENYIQNAKDANHTLERVSEDAYKHALTTSRRKD